MKALILRRILYSIPLVFGTALVLFLIFNVVPGDPALQIAGKHATPESIANIRRELGLDQPLYVQYYQMVKQLVTLDFGRSYSTKQPIIDMIQEGAGPSFSLVAPPFFISTFISLMFGLFLAVKRGTWFDRSATAMTVAAQSVSVLVYVLAGQYILAYQLDLFPISGFDSSLVGRWHYLMLPGIIYILLSLAPQIRFYRTLILDELYQDYVRTGHAKGLPASTVLFRHVLKNVMIPVITNLVISIPFLILGAVLLEGFFGIPGLGGLVVTAIQNGDRPVLISITLLGTVAYIIFDTLSDILYAWVDPRVQLK